jgi:hypothetical protein
MGKGESLNSFIINDPALIFLYQHLKSAYKTLIMEKQPSLSQSDEYDFIIQCAAAYNRIGCPSLAIQIISQYNLDKIGNIEIGLIDDLSNNDPNNLKDNEPANFVSKAPIPVVSNLFDEPKATAFDWGEMETSSLGPSGLNFGEMETSKGLDFGEMESSLDAAINMDDEFNDFKKTAMQKIDSVQLQTKSNMYVTEEQFEKIELDRECIHLYLLMLSIQIIQVIKS